MTGFARRNGRGVQAVLLGAALLLTACGGDKPAGQTADPANPAASPAAAGGTAAPPGSSGSPSAIAVAGAAAPLDTTTWVLPPPFYAAGQEPFWRIDIEDGWFSFKRSGLAKIEEPLVQPKQVSGADVFETGALKVSIKREACSTEQGGQGDFSATVVFDGLTFDGCAIGGAPVAKSAEAAAVVEGIKPIDACLAKLAEPALVTAVYPREDGERMAVGLRAKNGRFYECAVETASGQIAYLDPFDAGSQPAWISSMRFLREGVAAPACDASEEVHDGDKVVGRMLGKACKF